MKFNMLSPHGIAVQAQTTRFETIRLTSPDGRISYETVPVLQVGTMLIESVMQSNALATAISVHESDIGNIGIVYACAGEEIAALVFDLGQPEVQAWLRRSRPTGAVSLVFAGPNDARMVTLPAKDQFEQLSSATVATPAHSQQLQVLLTAVVELFDDAEIREHCRAMTSKVVRAANVSLVVPEDSGMRESALH